MYLPFYFIFCMKYLSTNPQSMEKWSFRDNEVLFHMTRQKHTIKIKSKGNTSVRVNKMVAPGLKFIWKKQFSMFFALSRLYLTLTTIETSEFSTLGRCFLKRVRFRYVTNHLKRRHYRVCSPAESSRLNFL
jgi:hypothetical protein